MILMESRPRHECPRHLRIFPAENAGPAGAPQDPMASVTTVLNRLVEYGEAEAVLVEWQAGVAVGCGCSREAPTVAAQNIVTSALPDPSCRLRCARRISARSRFGGCSYPGGSSIPFSRCRVTCA